MTSVSSVREFRCKVPATLVRSFVDPHDPEVHIHHAYVPVRSFPSGKIPDEVNPRRHEKLAGRVPKAIEESLRKSPKSLPNRRGMTTRARRYTLLSPRMTSAA